MQYHQFRAMSTDVVMAAEGTPEEIVEGFKQAKAFIHAKEAQFSRFIDTSELSRLNRSAGTWFSASAEMFDIISLALRLYRQTRGLFDPSILESLERAGYDRTIEEVRSQAADVIRGYAIPFSGAGSIQSAPAAPVTMVANAAPVRQGLYHFSDVRLEPEQKTKEGRIWLPPGMRIDLGGIGKGWIAERAARLLGSQVRACAVDAGGDLFMVGLPAGENAWRVALEDPCQPNQNLAILKAGPGAVCTSTTTKRRWLQDGQSRHHLIDPRTGLPAETDWLSVTVLGPHAAEAEVYAKSLLIGGRREVGRIVGSALNIEFITVDPLGKLWGSPHSLKILEM
jgi:thiamine biosynthesis lipoprotein